MMLYNEHILERFIHMFPDLEKDEVLFLSLSSRTKYLTPEQKKQGIVINRNEMFHRRWFSGNKKSLLEKIQNYLEEIKTYSLFVNDKKQEEYLVDFKTSSGHNIPMNTVSVYVNINPSSMMKAAANLGSEIFQKIITSDYEWFLKLQSKMNTEVQRAKSRREFVDIDFDDTTLDPVVYMRNLIGGTPIKTDSGHHLLIPKKNLTKGVNLGELVKSISEKFDNKEIVINKNAMVPLPGSYQGGVLVKFVE